MKNPCQGFPLNTAGPSLRLLQRPYVTLGVFHCLLKHRNPETPWSLADFQ
jgi:hypothetical protein